MTLFTPFGEAQNPFAGLADEDVIWDTLTHEAARRFGITSVLYAFTHSRFVTSRLGITSSLFLKQNLPADFLDAFPNGLTLDDDIAAELILKGEAEFLWQDFPNFDLRPEQRARYAFDCDMGMGVGVSFGFRFGGASGFGGMCWAKRHETPENFRKLWTAQQQDMRRLAHQFDAAMRPVMVRNCFRLSPREIDVMSYSAGGMTTKQIAEHLGLAPKTVSNTLERARKSMQAVSTMEAVAKALIYDLIG